MGRFAEKYTDEQRDAVAEAVVERRMTAVSAVALAAAGDLHDRNGVRLAPFEMPASTARNEARKLRKRLAGETGSPLTTQRNRDAVEVARKRLITLIDRELCALERCKPGTANLERLRQIGRATREVAALPDVNDPRPPAPGAGTGASRVGGDTRGGMAGDILEAAGLGRNGRQGA